ncbi:hypothetical protein [Hyphomonas atlantica]|nr:hypothetical protein [Hyphomonas atlantica]
MAVSASDPIARDTLCAINLCFRSKHPSFWNSLFYSLASGGVLSILFYWLLVALPRYKKRARMKRIFADQYRSFKLQCIDIFLVLSRSPSDHETASRMLNPVEFRTFFNEDTGDNQSRWHRFLNGLNSYYLDALARKMEHLRDEFRIFLLAVEADDPELVGLLKRFSEATSYHVTRSDDYDEVKSLSGYFWELFAGWSFAMGYRDDDMILDAISRI